MKYAGNEIEKHLYSLIGASFSVGAQSWNYYTNPPHEADESHYVWSSTEIVNEDGTKDDYLSEFFVEIAVVNRSGSNFTDNEGVDLCANHLMELLMTRGQQFTLPSFELVRTGLVTTKSLLEHEGQSTILTRKLIFSILAQEL